MDFQPLLQVFSQGGAPATVSPERRGTDLTAAFAASNPLKELKPRWEKIEDIMRKAADAAGMLNDESRAQMLATAEYFRDTQLERPEATGRIGLLELALHIRPNAVRSTSPVGLDFDSLLKAFEPVDPAAGFQQRIDAIGSRLETVAQAADKPSPSQRATMYEAAKYSREIRPDVDNAQGKIMFMESALGVQQSNLRAYSN